MFRHRFNQELKSQREAGHSLEKPLSHLRPQGASIIDCIVHHSMAWQDVAVAAEAMWEEMLEAMGEEDEIQPPEQTTERFGSD